MNQPFGLSQSTNTSIAKLVFPYEAGCQ